ncbi:MAG TPA: AMP-binding protein [Acidimicrobiales bacterium]|nr:AMP-binding protein [Acidimicrobiales bacterium]
MLVSEKARPSPVWDQACFLPREEIERRQLRRLQQLVAYCYDRVPLYRRVYDDAGFKPADLRTLEDFRWRVPRVDKPDLMVDQAETGVALANDVPHAVATYFHQTSGTTGEPLREWSAAYDMLTVGDSWITSWWAAGLRPGDGVYFCFNFGTFAGFWTAFYAAQRMGLTIYSGSSLSTAQRLEQLQQFRPAALVATPTYMLRMVDEGEQLGLDLRDLGLQYAIGGGEPATATARRRITDAFGLTAFCDQYGISDAMWGTCECPTESGGIHVFESAFYSYSIDPATGEPVEDDGEVGENVITAFTRSLQPIVNYRTHDLVRRHTGHDHGCGWTWQWLEGSVLGRTDFMVIIRGTNVYPTAVDNLLGEVPELSPNYEMHITTDRGLDSMTIKVEPAQAMSADEGAALAANVRRFLHQRLQVDLGVEVVEPGNLPRYELKTKRIFDHREREASHGR